MRSHALSKQTTETVEETFKSCLREAGYKVTPRRLALLKVLARSLKPVSIQELMRQLRNYSIDQATIYRILAVLTEIDIVREVNLHGEKPRYELNDEHDHHHLVCTNCHTIEDFVDEAHEKIAPRVLAHSKQFKTITGHSFDLYGLCNACAK